MKQSSNRLLQSLPQNILAALQPHLRSAEMSFGHIVAKTGEPVQRVYFPHSGVISLIVEMEPGHMIETAMVGRDGVANVLDTMDGKLALQTSIVQVAGTASTISPETLRSLANEFEPLRSLLMRHEQLVLAQAQQSAACNASHSTEARLCRWLLRMRDLTESDRINLTQEFLSHMLGVRRTSLSIVAGTLQRAGIISYRRGAIKIEDLDALRSASCECYEKIRSQYEQMFRR